MKCPVMGTLKSWQKTPIEGHLDVALLVRRPCDPADLPLQDTLLHKVTYGF